MKGVWVIPGLLAILVLSLDIGPTPLSLGQILGAVVHPQAGTPAVILWQIRLPRVVGGALVGAGLALAGLVFQALLQNPLADPYLIGTSSGASLGATLTLLAVPSVSAEPIGGFFGAVLAVFAAYAAARRGGRTSVVTVVLVGYALSVILGALTALLLFLHATALQSIFFWELGGLGGLLWSQDAELAGAVLIGVVGTLYFHRELDALSLGETEARSLGVDVTRTRWRLILLAGLVTAVAVSAAGLIGFIGLVAPHVARRLTGAVHRRALPMAMTVGAAFLVVADALARSFPQVGEIPVGIVTALLGGPFFIWLLLRRERGVRT